MAEIMCVPVRTSAKLEPIACKHRPSDPGAFVGMKTMELTYHHNPIAGDEPHTRGITCNFPLKNKPFSRTT